MTLLDTMNPFRVLVTCPPMLGIIDHFIEPASQIGIELVATNVQQTLSERELIDLLPDFDGWIIGDDPATRNVFQAAHQGSLRAAVKWGIGVDNVDFDACDEFGISITNTPAMFGAEVADLAVAYVTCLARHITEIDRGIREGGWPKPIGISLAGKTAAVIGYGDIGKNTARRLLVSEMKVITYDPFIDPSSIEEGIETAIWPDRISEADFVIVNCSLSNSSFHLINNETLSMMKPGVRIVNVGRGPVIDEQALISALNDGHVHSAALDVFECEPLPHNSPLRNHKSCIFGSHNASNTVDGVTRTSLKAIDLIAKFLNKSS